MEPQFRIFEVAKGQSVDTTRAYVLYPAEDEQGREIRELDSYQEAEAIIGQLLVRNGGPYTVLPIYAR